MDAISYLIQRKWATPGKVGASLFGGTLLTWLASQASTTIPHAYPHLFDNLVASLAWGLFAMVAGLIAIATALGVIVLAPLYVIYRLTNTLHAWIRQRAVEEMMCAGLTGAYLVDRVVAFGLRWWLIAAAPSLLLGFALFPALRQSGLANFWLAYLLAGAAATYLGLYATSWSGFASGKVKTPLLASMVVVQGVPALGLMLAGVSPLSLGAAALYVIAVARYAAIHALENAETLKGLDIKIRRTLRLKTSGRWQRLSENPILARETMRGIDSGDLISRLLTLGCFFFAVLCAVTFHASWAFLALVIPTVILNSYRAAGKMSQIVTEEVENATLETIRSTPLGSDVFLSGWIRSVMRTQCIDLGALLLATVSVMMLLGDGALLLNPILVLGLGLSIILPVLGAYVGASIAGQSKPRDEISGQLLLSVGAMAAIGAPQAVAAAKVISLPFTLVSSAILAAAFCWLLDAGARKSLNRVFLPQK